MPVILETDRLVLRRFTTDDVGHLVELDSDPEVMRFINGGKPTPLEVVEREILPKILAEYQRAPGFGRWAATHKASEEFLGWFSLRQHEDCGPNEAELGYRLRRAAWGQGYATEGARALIHMGFTELGLGRIIAQTMTVNQASRRVMEKVGLTYVRTFFQDWGETIEGSQQGDVLYALDRADWSGA